MEKQNGLEQTRRARGLVSSVVSGARVDAARIAPPPEVQELVETFWTGAWDLRGSPPHVTELIGDPCVHLVYEWSDTERGNRVVGPWTTLWQRTLEGRGHVFGIKLRSGYASAVVGSPVRRLNNTISPMTAGAPDLNDVLSQDAPLPDAILRLTDWLVSVAAINEDHRRAADAVRRITDAKELTRAETLADSLGLSLRGLQRLFSQHVGVAPKRVIRRHRLQEAAGKLERGEALSLVDLALDLGYADQAHLTRDFKAMTGKTPSQFRTAVWE